MIINELKTLDEFIKERKQLTIEQKLNMSLDEIISHKELNDDDYYKIESKDLDDELDEYFEIGKLDKELKDYFVISKKIKENNIDNEIVEWDYWGVTKTDNNDSQKLLLLNSNIQNKHDMKIIKKNNENQNEYKHLIQYYKTVFILYEKQIAEYKKENYKLKCNNKILRSHNRKLSKENKKLLLENKKYTSKANSNKNIRKNNFLKKNGKKIYYKIISNII